MKDKSIAILAVAAMVVVILAGMTWVYNNSIMTHGSANMKAAQNNSPSVQEDTGKQNTNSHENMKTPEKTIPAAAQDGVNSHGYAKNLIKPRDGQPIKKFSLTARENILEIKKGLSMPVWTYNGTVPGTEIRVIQGDFVQVELKNELKDPVTIHWHGYPLLSAMDGVPGFNQDSVRPGETFTYEFSADIAGTYWYHSHQEGAKQVDKGLYGALIVEPRNKGRIDKDYTLILDEWTEKPLEEMEAMEGMSSEGSHAEMADENKASSQMAGHGSGMSDIEDEEMMSSQYNIYTVNGKSGELITPLEVKKGDVVRLRLVNAGYRSHGIHIPGQDIRVVSTDGQDIQGAGIIRNQIVTVAPGERYDIEFTVTTDRDFIIDAHDNNKYNDQLKILVKVTDGSGKLSLESKAEKLTVFDLTTYGEPGKGSFSLEQKYDVDYSVLLGTRADGNSLKYTINSKVFDELPTLKVKTGDLVKFTFENKTNVDHPMHLHGHFFQVLSRNSQAVSGAPIIKDTLLVKPGEKYVVAFKADNTGKWVQHCHELHHAAAGMMQGIEYTDFKPNYVPDPNNKFNKPE